MSTPAYVDTRAAHAATGQLPATIRLWVHRGELTHHGYDRRGRALVELGELEQLITDKANKARQAAA